MDETPAVAGSVKEPVSNPLIRAHLFRRSIAYTVDIIILGAIAAALVFAFPAISYSFGVGGWWLGGGILLLYFSFFQTRITKGQTPGGKLLGIVVIGTNGAFLPPYKAVLRTAIFVFIYFGTELSHLGSVVVNSVLFVIVGIVSAAFVVFLIFHPLRRSIHDLAADSIVVRRKEYEALSEDEKKQFLRQPVSLKKPIFIFGGVVVILVGAGVWFYYMFGNPLTPLRPYFSAFQTVQQSVEHVPGVAVASVTASVSQSPSEAARTLKVGLIGDRSVFADAEKREALAQKIDAQIVENFSKINLFDYVEIDFTSDFGLGIMSLKETYTHASSTLEIFKSVYGSKPHWLAYAAPLFVVDFPAPPRVGINAGTAAEMQGFYENDIYTTNNSTTTMFILEAAEFLPETVASSSPMDFLRHSLDTVKKTASNELISSSFSTFKGNPSVNISYYDSAANQYVKILFFYWSGKPYNIADRYYGLSEIYSKGYYNDADFNRYVNSFVPRTASTSVPSLL